MEHTSLSIADLPLKCFLLLFDAAAPIDILALGDTMHPSSGLAGVELVAGITSISGLLAHAYNFDGLIYFEAITQGIRVKYQSERYEIISDKKTITKMEDKIRKINFSGNNLEISIL